MTNMEWCVVNNIAANDLYCTRNSYKKPTMRENTCYIIKEVHGLVYSEFEDDATDFAKVILDWLATALHNDCDTIYKAYHKGFLDGYEERKEEEKKKTKKADNKKAIFDDMNEAMRHEFESCFGGIQQIDEHEFESCFFGEKW